MEKYPQPSRDRMEARKKLENNLKFSTKITIKKENLKTIKTESTDEDYKKFLLDKEKIQDKFFETSMKSLIAHNDSSYFTKMKFILSIIYGSDTANIPPQEIDVVSSGRQFLFKILEKRDPLGIIIGEQPYSGCCFKIDGAAETSLLESYINPNTGILVVYDTKGDFVAQSWIWLTMDKKSLVLDNVEFATKFKSIESQDEVRLVFEKIFKQENSSSVEKSIDIKTIIQNAYKEFAKIYKAKTGLNILVGTGYDDLGVSSMDLEALENWDNKVNYPLIENFPYLTDSSTVLKLANWYKQYKMCFGKNEV
jgi:hypothetical protein